MLRRFTAPFSIELYEDLLTWVTQQQSTRAINLEVPMNLSSLLEEDGYPEAIYLIYEEESIIAGAVVVDILKTKDYEIGLAAMDEQMVFLMMREIQKDLQVISPNSVTAVIDERAVIEKKALFDMGANFEVSEAQLMVTQLSGKTPTFGMKLVPYTPLHHNDYRAVLMESFGDDEAEAEAIIQLSLSQANRTFYGIHVNDEIVGTINLIRSEEAFITALAVHPKHQKRGIGRAALHEAVDRLFQDGYRSVSLDVEVENTNALKLYKEVGFQIQYMFQFFRL